MNGEEAEKDRQKGSGGIIIAIVNFFFGGILFALGVEAVREFCVGYETQAAAYGAVGMGVLFVLAGLPALICLFLGFFFSVRGDGHRFLALAAEGGEAYWTAFASACVFYYLAALPCFAILFYLWKVSDLVRERRLFSREGVGCFYKSAIILFADLLFFVAGNFVLWRMGRNEWFWAYIFLALCGCAVALFFFIISKCLGEAAKLQEESDETI